jgi:hypothetical protein
MRRLTRRTLLAWAGLGALSPACISPTLPLPPPSVPDTRDLGNGQFELRGAIPIEGTVFFRNERTTLVFGKGPVTEYDLTVPAQSGDTMTLWYQTEGDDLSSEVAFLLSRAKPIIGDGGS